MSGPFMFGVSTVPLTRKQIAVLRGIAAEHDCSFFEVSGRAAAPASYRSWFATRNLGSPFNERTARAVREAVAACGIER